MRLERLWADWPLKLLALCVAFGIWVAITGEAHTVRDVTLPLEMEFPRALTSAATLPTAVTVRLEGPETMVRRLDPVRLAVRVDLGDTPAGPRDVQFSRAHLVGVPDEVEVAFFSPDRVSLVIEPRLRREVEVVPDLVGQPPEGYAVYGAQTRPAKVTVEGPESALRDVTRVTTDPLALGTHTRPFTETVWAVPDRPQVRVVAPNDRLEVRVVIDQAPTDVTFEGIPVALRSASGSVSPDPYTVKVTVSGPPALVERLDRSHIRATVDVGATQGSGRGVRAPVQTSLIDLAPDELSRLSIRSVDPALVALRFREGAP
jgi:YbbR domain-containing protein